MKASMEPVMEASMEPIMEGSMKPAMEEAFMEEAFMPKMVETIAEEEESCGEEGGPEARGDLPNSIGRGTD